MVLLFTVLLGLAGAWEPGEVLRVPEGSVLSLPPIGEEGETPSPFPIGGSFLTSGDPPPFKAGINLVPPGSWVILRHDGPKFQAWRVAGKAFLLPESHYDKALLKARQLDICKPALDSITEETLQMAERTYTALSSCGDQFDSDESLISELTGNLQSMETRALVAEDRLKQARKNTAVAWAITGGILFGGSAAMALTL